jgi:hypothetical protein
MSLAFDGVDDIALCNDTAVLQTPTTDVTLVLWVNTNLYTATFSSPWWRNGYKFVGNSNMTTGGEFNTTGGGGNVSNGTSPQGTWVMIASRWTASNGQMNGFTFNTDGDIIGNGSGFRSGSNLDYSQGLQNVFGRRAGAGYFSGKMAHASVFSRFLSNEELISLAQGASPTDFANLVEYWPMVGSRFAAVADHNLTLQGAIPDTDNPPVEEKTSPYVRQVITDHTLDAGEVDKVISLPGTVETSSLLVLMFNSRTASHPVPSGWDEIFLSTQHNGRRAYVKKPQTENDNSVTMSFAGKSGIVLTEVANTAENVIASQLNVVDTPELPFGPVTTQEPAFLLGFAMTGGDIRLPVSLTGDLSFIEHINGGGGGSSTQGSVYVAGAYRSEAGTYSAEAVHSTTRANTDVALFAFEAVGEPTEEYDPADLAVVQIDSDVHLEWPAPTLEGATHTDIFRRSGTSETPFDPEVDTRLARVPVAQLTYVDEDVPDGDYAYQVFPVIVGG